MQKPSLYAVSHNDDEQSFHDEPQPLLTHLIELRKRLIYSFVLFTVVFLGCYTYSDCFFEILVRPLTDLLKGQPERKLIYTGLTEAFLTYLKVGMFSATFISFPFFAMQLWLFIAPGLYKNEKKIFLPLLVATPFLFFVGSCFAYFFVLPKAYSFFLSFESPATETMLAIQLEAKVNEYLSFVMRLILAFGISFELPILLSLMGKAGFLTSKTLMDKWRLAVVCLFTFSAIITPPDLLSMIALALPLIALYGLAIVMVKFFESHRSR